MPGRWRPLAGLPGSPAGAGAEKSRNGAAKRGASSVSRDLAVGPYDPDDLRRRGRSVGWSGSAASGWVGRGLRPGGGGAVARSAAAGARTMIVPLPGLLRAAPASRKIT
ncbi:hypothetical protein GCM10009734_87290 [Nonomuraea bangladeshensis]